MSRVEHFVAHEIETRSVEVVGARFDRQRDDAGGGATVLGGKAVRDHLELRNGVNIGLDDFLLAALGRDRLVVIVHAVHQEADLRTALAADRDTLTARGRDAGRDQGELKIVPPVQREINDLPVLDYRASRRFGGLQQRSGRLDLDDFGHSTDLERDVELARISDR